MTDQIYADWIGKETTSEDIISLQPARFMQATLDREPDLRTGDTLPPLWHWLYCLEALPTRHLGRDAHPKKGGFLPPISLPRRMWAGRRFTFSEPLKIGERATKRSVIQDVTAKRGRSGDLCFVTVRHEIHQQDRICVTEEHDIVYREDPKQGDNQHGKTVPENADFTRLVSPSEVMLFRYSALTFNGHRIHYDAEYARNVEGYEGLVFHGPLTATLLIDLACDETGR